MTHVVKNNQLMRAVRVETPILLPLDDGEVLTIARNGDFCLFNEEQEFVRIVDGKKFSTEYTQV